MELSSPPITPLTPSFPPYRDFSKTGGIMTPPSISSSQLVETQGVLSADFEDTDMDIHDDRKKQLMLSKKIQQGRNPSRILKLLQSAST